MYKRFLLQMGVVLLCLSLSGCSLQFKTDTKDLMNPPTLTQEQAEIKDTLALAVGDTNIKYKYPQNGEYHSSFILYDIDGDKSDEALVFYQSPSRGDSTWMNILDKEDGQWVSVCEKPAPESRGSTNDISIDVVYFDNLTDDEHPNIIIGWVDSRQTKTVVVYSYQNRNLSEVFQYEYGEMSITDLDRNGMKDMVLLLPESQKIQVFLASRTAEGFSIVNSASLDHPNYNFSSFAQITAGRFDYNTNALFLDLNLMVSSNRVQYTDVISAENVNGVPRLVNLLDNGFSLSSRTRRPKNDIFCRDIDKDGLVEIPTLTNLPGYDTNYEGEQIYLTSYNVVEDGLFIPRMSGVINNNHRYMITFPDKWLDGKVTVVSQPENGEWTFMKYNNSLTDTSTPLLRIRVYSTKDYHDKFESNFKLIGSQGLFEYYASIPKTTDDLGITEADLEEMFRFIE